jgi:hypothetical protein
MLLLVSVIFLITSTRTLKFFCQSLAKANTTVIIGDVNDFISAVFLFQISDTNIES